MRPFVLVTLILTACSNVVPSTVMQLDALSPIEADPADVVVAINLPEGLEIAPNSARLMLAIQRSDSGEAKEGIFVLERVPAQQAVLRIAPEDRDSLRDLQTTARQWKLENDEASNGSLSVTLSPCRVGNGPAADARASLAIRLTEDGPFLPLIRNGPVSAVVKPEQLRDMGPCETAR